MSRYIQSIKRLLPRLIIASGVTFSLQKKWLVSFQSKFKPVSCFSLNIGKSTNPLYQLVCNVVRIMDNGAVVGYAFCYMNNCLVSASPDLFEAIKKKGANFQKQLSFYIGQRKLQGNWQVIGQFENMSFIKCANENIPEIKPFQQNNQILNRVQIIEKRSYLNVNDGYLVGFQGGFGIVNGKGQVGSLVVSQNKVSGVVTHVGHDQQKGYLRIVLWNNLKNIARRIRQPPVYLGISVAPSEKGVTIVRVASNSPLKDNIKIGDEISCVNGCSITSPEDILRAVMMSGQVIRFSINGKEYDITAVL